MNTSLIAQLCLWETQTLYIGLTRCFFVFLRNPSSFRYTTFYTIHKYLCSYYWEQCEHKICKRKTFLYLSIYRKSLHPSDFSVLHRIHSTFRMHVEGVRVDDWKLFQCILDLLFSLCQRKSKEIRKKFCESEFVHALIAA